MGITKEPNDSKSKSFEEFRSNNRDNGRKVRRGRSPSRSPSRGSRGPSRRGRSSSREYGRKEVEITTVTCSSCKEECKVPFKPDMSKPVYCDSCFSKRSGGSGRISKDDIDSINGKLDQIMKALKIE